MRGALLIVGTGSNVGKSTVVTGLLRVLARRGVRAAPFKGQNMALNAAVAADGGEIGRAQALQARAARLEPSVLMNPVLLKPSGPSRSQLIVLGRPYGELEASRWMSDRQGLREVVLDAFDQLRARVDVVIAEGAGSAAEINLLDGDLANLTLAAARQVPAVVVGDIDRGGVFASLFGHYTLLPPRLARYLRGFIITKLRGDADLLAAGVSTLERRLKTRCVGIVPWHPVDLPGEDSLVRRQQTAGSSERVVRVGVVELPHLANATDFDPLFVEGYSVRWLRTPEELSDCDLVILPGSKATVHDLSWLRRRGFGVALSRYVARGGWLLGICAGYQMLAADIDDAVESREGRVPGLGMLEASVVFEPTKVVREVDATLAWPDHTAVRGYFMHHGRVVSDHPPLMVLESGQGEGAVRGRVLATSLHGLFDVDAARRALLGAVAEDRGRILPPRVAWQQHLDAMIDDVADLLERHLSMDYLDHLIEHAGQAP